MENTIDYILRTVFEDDITLLDRKFVHAWMEKRWVVDMDDVKRVTLRDFENFHGYYISEEEFAVEWFMAEYGLPKITKEHLNGESIVSHLNYKHWFWSMRVDEENIAIFLT